MSAVENMQSYAQIEEQRAQDAKAGPSLPDVYSSMTDQQKKAPTACSAPGRRRPGRTTRLRRSRQLRALPLASCQGVALGTHPPWPSRVAGAICRAWPGAAP